MCLARVGTSMASKLSKVELLGRELLKSHMPSEPAKLELLIILAS